MLDMFLPLMAALLGFAAHRAGLCTVKAVAEMITSRTAWLLASFAKAAGWVIVLTTLGSLLALEPVFRSYAVTWSSMAGGLLFGVGAAMNGGCSFSTLAQLADGKFRFGVTIAMWPVGMAIAIASGLQATPEAVVRIHATMDLQNMFGLYMVTGLLIWALVETGRLAIDAIRGRKIVASLLSPSYRLSSAAFLIGVTNAVLVYNIGNWSFTSSFLCLSSLQAGVGCDRPLMGWMLPAAAFGGMVVSTIQRKTYLPVWPSARDLAVHGTSGIMMGLGAAAIPGGNDGLILFGIPSLSPHAIPAYVAILAGIWIMLSLRRRSGRAITVIECSGDICRTR